MNTEILDLDKEWEEFGVWYCEHSYYQGRHCPNCDVPSHWPELPTTDDEAVD